MSLLKEVKKTRISPFYIGSKNGRGSGDMESKSLLNFSKFSEVFQMFIYLLIGNYPENCFICLFGFKIWAMHLD